MKQDKNATPKTKNKRKNKISRKNSMENSVLRFRDVNFVVGKGEKRKKIVSDVSGSVVGGRVLAVMGPSGAGKTTLINALTLSAHYGKAHGRVTLNGEKMTDAIFRQHCFVVVQQDKHWPYLTCRETLQYAAELYNVKTAGVVDAIISKMGLKGCADTRNASMSGGERRRLSIGVALLKRPTVLFLDEPTSGLDAAAASSIMQEILRVAKEEGLAVFCTIHQPSTKVYNNFDQLMIMSRGRQAFAGEVDDAIDYFESIGHRCPRATNPAEYFLDLVNSDFSDEKVINGILDAWEEKRPGAGNSSHPHSSDGEENDPQGVTNLKGIDLKDEIKIMFRRHALIVRRDPLLYVGRCGIFLVSCLFFAFVYWNGRTFGQDQALNKLWVNIWFIGVPSNMGVVAVYSLNSEFKLILRETKNGMIRGTSYAVAKTVLVLPIFFIFALCALGVPSFVVQNNGIEAFVHLILLFVAIIYLFESVAECLSVWFEDPIMGMLQFMNFWFASFLFGGFLIPRADMYWPFELFYFIMPYHYYVRSSTRAIFKAGIFEPCDPESVVSAVCLPETDGLNILHALSQNFPLLSREDNFVRDIVIILVIGTVYKALHIFGILYRTSMVAEIHDTVPKMPDPVDKAPSSDEANASVKLNLARQLEEQMRRDFEVVRLDL